MDCGGTMKEDAVMAPLTVAPGAGAALVVGTEHEVISIPGVQVKATAPVKPPSPVTTTGNEPVAPLATLMAAAETEKSHAVPLRVTVLILPSVCVTVRVPATGPGVVVAMGLNVTVTTQAAPAGAITIGNAPLLHAAVLEVSVKTPGAAAIAEMLSGALPLLPIETVALVDVVSKVPGRVKLVGVIVTLDVVPEPVPESATRIGWAEVSRESTIFRVAISATGFDGVKVTPIVQDAPAARDVVQGDAPPAAPTKSAELVPVVAGGRVKVTADAVLFVTVTNCGCEATAISWVPNSRLVGDTEIVGVSGNSATKAFVEPFSVV